MAKHILTAAVFTMLCGTYFTAEAAPYPANYDYVLHVEACSIGSDEYVLIQMKSAGWVYIDVAASGFDQANRIMTLAMNLELTGKQTGAFDPDFTAMKNFPTTSTCNAPGLTKDGALLAAPIDYLDATSSN